MISVDYVGTIQRIHVGLMIDKSECAYMGLFHLLYAYSVAYVSIHGVVEKATETEVERTPSCIEQALGKSYTSNHRSGFLVR